MVPQTRYGCFVASAPRNDAGGTLRLALPLSLPPGGLIDLDRNGERLVAATIAGAADRRCAEVVEADGDAGMGVGGADAVGGVEPDPAQIRHEGLRPGVAGCRIDGAVGAQEMPGDETCRHAAASRAGDEDMRVVLADAALAGEGF